MAIVSSLGRRSTTYKNHDILAELLWRTQGLECSKVVSSKGGSGGIANTSSKLDAHLGGGSTSLIL